MPLLVRHVFFALCAGFVLLAVPVANAQPSAARFEAAVAREFQIYAKSDGRLDEAIRQIYPERLSPAKHLLVRKELRELEAAFLARTPNDYFRDVTELYFRATLAELDQFPHRRTVSREQVQLAERVYENRLQALLKRFPDVLPARNLPATAQQEYQYMMLVLQALVEMPDPYRSWQLTSITIYAAQ